MSYGVKVLFKYNDYVQISSWGVAWLPWVPVDAGVLTAAG